jgi:hypothetical protein
MNATVSFSHMNDYRSEPIQIREQPSRPPRPQVSVDEARASLADATPVARKASRRWIWDLLMLVVGAAVGVWFGSASIRSTTITYVSAKYAQLMHPKAKSGQVAAAAEQPADVVVVSVQRAHTPALDRSAATMDAPAAPPPADVKAEAPAASIAAKTTRVATKSVRSKSK